MFLPELKAGMTKSVQKTITKADTALNFGSGALKNLLATPTLAALMIEAAVMTVDPLLPDGYITIGKTLNIEHDHPTVEGMTVTVSATLKEAKGATLLFEIKAYDEISLIGTGEHERHIVNHDKLMEKVNERCRVLEKRV